MNIKPYLFRLTIAGIAFILGFSAQRGFQKLEQSSLHWLNRAAPAMKEPASFQSKDQKLAVSPHAEPKSEAFYDFSGEWYLSEEKLPRGLSYFCCIELKMQTDPNTRAGNSWTLRPQSGAIHADTRTYKFTTISIRGEGVGFETEVIDGICYKFFGRSVPGQGLKNPYRSGVGDISGKLEKWEKGSLIATIETTFYLFNSQIQIR